MLYPSQETMENLIWYASIALVFYLLARWVTPQSSQVDKDIDEILTREEYKVKGRFN